MAAIQPPAWVSTAIEKGAPGIYRYFWDRLQASHRGLKVTVTSYWRSWDKNAQVQMARGRSVTLSQHLIGTGIDFVYPNQSTKALAVQRMKSFGLHVIDEGDHIHVQVFPAGIAEKAGLYRRIGIT